MKHTSAVRNRANKGMAPTILIVTPDRWYQIVSQPVFKGERSVAILLNAVKLLVLVAADVLIATGLK